MMWGFVLLWTMFGVMGAVAQTRTVDPAEVSLSVTVEQGAAAPFVDEMVLITIEGRYRRHITLESLQQPNLDGFNWMQLGPDQWFETTERGLRVRNFRRRMALYPDRPGQLTIGAFVHRLNLTDETTGWFEHDVASDPVTIEVLPAPSVGDWWLPVRRIEVSDHWSNAPDRLQPGEGVLRVVRIEAVGVPPEMIPPMPELRSPSGMIFAHPEKRMVELSPEGPVSIAFWRWTIRPGNDASAIVEPIGFDYFDTDDRQAHRVEISAQRIAMDQASLPEPVVPPPPAPLRAGILAALFGLALVAGLGAVLAGRQFAGLVRLRRLGPFDPLRRALRRAARAGDWAGLRRAAVALMARDGATPARRALLDDLDRSVFARAAAPVDPAAFARHFVRDGPRRV